MSAQLGAPPTDRSLPRPNLIVFPAWSENNPYLNVTYLFTRSAGWVIRPATRLAPFYELLHSATSDDVVHIHWTAPISQHAPDARDAAERLRRFVSEVSRVKKLGVRVLWTIHNVMPHDCPYPEVEVDVVRALNRLADRIIIINPATPEAMAPFVSLDVSKIVVLPHPSYVGLYADDIDREAARAQLGLEPDSRGVLFFGQIRRYKGLDGFLQAMSQVSAENPRAVTLMAGKTKPEDQAWIDSVFPSDLPAIREHSFVDDNDVQLWFRSADVVVFPFDRVLNSGSMYLAATFGCPVIVPRDPLLLAEFGEQEWIEYVDDLRAPGALAAAISRRLDSPGRAHQAALDFARARTPSATARRFSELIGELKA